MTLARIAHAAINGIFREKDPGVVGRFFAEPFVQHDGTLADGLSGLDEYARDVAGSRADLTIYRTIEDCEFVMLHSMYRGLPRNPGPMIAFDLLRFRDEKIVELWRGQQPEAPANLSGHTQLDGPTEVSDRDKTEANRDLVRRFKEVVTVEARFDRVGEFIEGNNYTQHAATVGDGTERMRKRVAGVLKPGAEPTLKPVRYVAEGNFVLALVDAKMPQGPTANWDLFRVQNGWIVEHWDVISPILPRKEWRHSNGPF
jgi:predicted SnoaL-like aldol condensation-catalyzing enzyme